MFRLPLLSARRKLPSLIYGDYQRVVEARRSNNPVGQIHLLTKVPCMKLAGI